MKNKNIKNKPRKCGTEMAFPAFMIFQNFPGEDPRSPLIKKFQICTSIKPSEAFFNNNSSKRHKKKSRKAPPPPPAIHTPIKIIYKKIIFRLSLGARSFLSDL